MGKCEIHCHWAHFLPTCLFLSMCKTLTTVVSIQLIFLPSVEVIVITLLGIFYEYRSLWEGNYRNCFLWRLHSQQEREDPLSMPKLFHVKTKKQAFPGQLQQLLNRLVSLTPNLLPLASLALLRPQHLLPLLPGTRFPRVPAWLFPLRPSSL